MQSNAQYLLNLENRIAELETQVCNLQEKSLGVKKHIKEITDTERLDFIEKNLCEIGYSEINAEDKEMDDMTWNLYNYDFESGGGVIDIDVYAKTLRESIDAAMRGKDDH